MTSRQSSARLPLDLPAENRRSAPRIGVTYRVSLRYGARELICHTSDISLTGTFVETREEIAPGTPVHLSFAVGQTSGDATVEVEGRVARWVSPAVAGEAGCIPGCGVEFTRFIWGADGLRNALDQLLAGCRSPRDAGRRRSARVAVGLPIYWGDTGKPTQTGFLTNLSTSGGFFIETGTSVPVGTRLHLWFELPVRGEIHSVRAVASVARVTAGKANGEASGMGVQFERSSIDWGTLQDFLDGRISRVVAQAPPPQGSRPRPVRPAGPATAAAPAPKPAPPTARHEREEQVNSVALDRLFVEAVAECEEEERRKRLPGGPPMDEELRPDDTPAASDATWAISRLARLSAPTHVDWPQVGRLTLKVSGILVALLLASFMTLILLHV